MRSMHCPPTVFNACDGTHSIAISASGTNTNARAHMRESLALTSCDFAATSAGASPTSGSLHMTIRAVFQKKARAPQAHRMLNDQYSRCLLLKRMPVAMESAKDMTNTTHLPASTRLLDISEFDDLEEQVPRLLRGTEAFLQNRRPT